MKIRNNFISNSSSSSFILFKSEPGTPLEELERDAIEKSINFYGDDFLKENKKYWPWAIIKRKMGERFIAEVSIKWGGEEGARALFNIMNDGTWRMIEHE